MSQHYSTKLRSSEMSWNECRILGAFTDMFAICSSDSITSLDFFHQAERPWNKGCFPPTGRSNSPLASTCTIQWSMNLVHQYEQKHPAVILHRAECFPLPLSDRKSIYIVDCPLAMFDYRWQPAWNSEGVWLASSKCPRRPLTSKFEFGFGFGFGGGEVGSASAP